MNFMMLYHFYQESNARKVEKHMANLHDKTEYVIHTINLKQALNHGLILKNVHRVNKFSEKKLVKTLD